MKFAGSGSAGIVSALLAGTAAAAAVTRTRATEPCAVASSLWAAANGTIRTIPAVAAYECLRSVPLHQKEALDLMNALDPYMEWQSDPAYKANPPADYFYPAYDIFATLDDIKDKIRKGAYTSEYDFQSDLYLRVFGRGHDGHFVFYPDLLTRAFDFNRPLSLVSISEDGAALPVIKVYEDVVAAADKASAVTHINGVQADKYVADAINMASFNQDPDAAYNSMFFAKAVFGASEGAGYFQGGGRVRYVYQGANTTLTFANGTETVLENYARVKSSLAGITDGESMYKKFCTPVTTTAAAAASSAATPAATSVPGFPTPEVITSDAIVSCYFLDGAGFEDVAVLSLLAFESQSPLEFQTVQAQCLAKAVAAGKTKLVVDLSANGGGFILQGYDFFRQLFPHIVQDGYSRWRENDGFLALAEIDSALAAGLDPLTSDDKDRISASESWFNYRYDLDVDNKKFASYDAKFAPHVFQDTNYTALMRWDLDDPLTTVNDSYGIGMEISGYGQRTNLTQPFAAEDIILVYDGFCASTCTLASEMLRIQAGVRSVAFGGRPVAGSIQGVGGIKGSQTLQFDDIHTMAQVGLKYATTDAQRAALKSYSPLPVQRSTAAALNTRDQILRDNVADGLPAQFVVEEADCRLYWTADMVTDVTAVWKAAARSAFHGAPCAAGAGLAPPKDKRELSAAEQARRRAVSSHMGQGYYDFKAIERRMAQNKQAFNAKYNQKVVE